MCQLNVKYVGGAKQYTIEFFPESVLSHTFVSILILALINFGFIDVLSKYWQFMVQTRMALNKSRIIFHMAFYSVKN